MTRKNPAKRRTASKAATKTVVRRLNPTCKLPTQAVLRRLTALEGDELERLLTTPQECVYHPSFRSAIVPGSASDEDHPVVEESTAALKFTGGPTEVLTADEEQVLFLRFNYCRNRILRILREYRGKRLTAAAARDLLHWSRLVDQTRDYIVHANTSLVLAMARRSRNSGVELSELVSEGNLALLRCVDKFDAARGFKFSTYACRAILASFSRAGAKATRYRVQFPTTYDPALERSDFLDLRRERVEHECVDELKRILLDNAAELSTVERRVLDARFSLREPETSRKLKRKTLDQVGSQLGVSKERVRQIQNQAMSKLRDMLEERLLIAS